MKSAVLGTWGYPGSVFLSPVGLKVRELYYVNDLEMTRAICTLADSLLLLHGQGDTGFVLSQTWVISKYRSTNTDGDSVTELAFGVSTVLQVYFVPWPCSVQ